MVVNPVDRPLYYRPVVFDSLRVNVAAHVLNLVIDDGVRHLVPYQPIGMVAVCHQVRVLNGDVPYHDRLDSFGCRCSDLHRADPATTFHHSEHNGFLGAWVRLAALGATLSAQRQSTSLSVKPLAFVDLLPLCYRMAATTLAAHVCLVSLNNAR